MVADSQLRARTNHASQLDGLRRESETRPPSLSSRTLRRILGFCCRKESTFAPSISADSASRVEIERCRVSCLDNPDRAARAPRRREAGRQPERFIAAISKANQAMKTIQRFGIWLLLILGLGRASLAQTCNCSCDPHVPANLDVAQSFMIEDGGTPTQFGGHGSATPQDQSHANLFTFPVNTTITHVCIALRPHNGGPMQAAVRFRANVSGTPSNTILHQTNFVVAPSSNHQIVALTSPVTVSGANWVEVAYFAAVSSPTHQGQRPSSLSSSVTRLGTGAWVNYDTPNVFPGLRAIIRPLRLITAPPTRTLTVQSTPVTGVPITVAPSDINGQGNGNTNFVRVYNQGTNVSLTAPAFSGTNHFRRWRIDGADQPASQTSIAISMTANHTVVAVYVATRTLTVQSTPSTGVLITVSPSDNNNQGSGFTNFTRSYDSDKTVALTAPSTSASNTFERWRIDGVNQAVGQLNISVAMTNNHTVVAQYVHVPSVFPFCFGDGSGAACPCTPGPVGGGCANSSGNGAHLSTPNGSVSVAADDLTLSCTGMMFGSFAIFCQGTTQVNGGLGTTSSFSDGLDCVGGSKVRLALVLGLNGSASVGQIASRGAATPGSTLYYQAIYRNAASYCTPAKLNTSNGVGILWSP